jgi:transposase, IS30 family
MRGAPSKRNAKKLNISFYFADLGCSWQRGANENANRLIRQFFHKKTDFSSVTKEEVAYVEILLNNRPRKRLGLRIPLEKLKEVEPVAFIS